MCILKKGALDKHWKRVGCAMVFVCLFGFLFVTNLREMRWRFRESGFKGALPKRSLFMGIDVNHTGVLRRVV